MAKSDDVKALQAIQKQGAAINVAIGEAIQKGCPDLGNQARYEVSTEAFRKVADALREQPGLSTEDAVSNVGVCSIKQETPRAR